MRDIKDKYKLIWEPLQRLRLLNSYRCFYDNDDSCEEEYYESQSESGSGSEEESEIIEITKGVNLEYYMAVTMPDIIKDRSFILEIILRDAQHVTAYAYLLQLWNDRYFIMELLQYYPPFYAHISDELKKDKQILCLALKNIKNIDSDILRHSSEELRNDREIAIMAIENIGSRILVHLSENLRGDAEIVLLACRNDFTYTSLIYATESLLNNKDFFKKVVQINGRYLRFASTALKDDRELVLEAIKNNGCALLYSPKLRLDRYFVLEAVGVNVTCLEGAGLEFLEDREFIFCAVKQNGLALQFASHKLRNDPEIMSEAIKQIENVNPLPYGLFEKDVQ